VTDPSGRRSPPENPEDWEYIWKAARYSHEARPFLGPFIAIAKNWKGGAAVIVFVVWINSPDIVNALRTLAGWQP